MAQKNVKFVGKTSILPISTMLYMSESDLHERLKILTNLFKLDYAYICHKGESGKKDHIHIILRTQAKQFSNIDKIRECLFEICDVDTDVYKKGQSKPCKPFVESKSIRDWYLYSMHNKEYLSEKGESREFEYSPSDIKGSPNFIDDMQEITANFVPVESDFDIIKKGIENGFTDLEIISQLKGITSTNLYSTLKGIEETRKLINVDTTGYQKALEEFANCVLWQFDEKGLRECIDKHENMNDVRLAPIKVCQQIIKNAISHICTQDFYDACCDVVCSTKLMKM